MVRFDISGWYSRLRLHGCLLLAIALVAIPVHGQSRYTLPTHHVPQVVASGKAKAIGLLPVSQNMHLDILLSLRHQAALNRLMKRLYDPSSPDYRHFLTPTEFTEQFGPTQSDYQAVIAWAKARGFTVGKEPSDRLIVPITGTASDVESAFNVVLRRYERSTSKGSFFAPDREPSVAGLSVPLWHIGGLSSHAIPHAMYDKGTGPSAAVGSGPSGSLLGSDRRAAYYSANADPSTLLAGAGQTVGLFELDGYNSSDVNQYFSNIGQSMNVPVNNVLVDGASASSDGDDTEQVIDIVDAVSMAPSLKQVLVFIGPGGSGFIAGVTDADILNKMASSAYYNVVRQISISYGWGDDKNTDDQIFEEMAGDGQSVFVASGDNNAWTSGDAYPSESAWVTGVGGTLLFTNGAGGSWDGEEAWGGGNSSCQNNGGGSGGGISPDDIPIPNYQQLSGVINSSNGGSVTYRNGPDVAAQADCVNYYCANGSCGEGLGGTSLAAPTWAAITALANQAGVQYGTATGGLGLVNNSIYPIGVGSTYGDYFHDVTSGDNNTYSAVSGYDLVTGWGSPSAWNLVYQLAGVTQAQAPSLSQSETNGPATCGNALAGYNNACWITLTVTATAPSGEALYVGGQQRSSPDTYTETENWGTGSCENTQDGYLCFGYAPFPPVTNYSTESGYGNSQEVNSD